MVFTTGPKRKGEATSRFPLSARSHCRDLFDLVDDGLEGVGMVHGQVGQYFAVQLDIAFRQFMDQAGVGDVMLTGSSVDPGDPEAAESAFFAFPVAISVLHSFFEGVFSNRIDFAAGAEVPPGCF